MEAAPGSQSITGWSLSTITGADSFISTLTGDWTSGRTPSPGQPALSLEWSASGSETVSQSQSHTTTIAYAKPTSRDPNNWIEQSDSETSSSTKQSAASFQLGVSAHQDTPGSNLLFDDLNLYTSGNQTYNSVDTSLDSWHNVKSGLDEYGNALTTQTCNERDTFSLYADGYDQTGTNGATTFQTDSFVLSEQGQATFTADEFASKTSVESHPFANGILPDIADSLPPEAQGSIWANLLSLCITRRGQKCCPMQVGPAQGRKVGIGRWRASVGDGVAQSPAPRGPLTEHHACSVPAHRRAAAGLGTTQRADVVRCPPALRPPAGDNASAARPAAPGIPPRQGTANHWAPANLLLGAAHCPAPGAAAPHDTTPRHKTPLTDVRRVHYAFHPWFGRDVFVLEQGVRGGQVVYDARPDQESARALEIPAWMFDAVACAALTVRDQPRVSFQALRGLRQLLGARPAPGAGVEDQHPPAPSKGDADATDRPFPATHAAAGGTGPRRPTNLGDAGPSGPAAGDRPARPDAARMPGAGRRRASTRGRRP